MTNSHDQAPASTRGLCTCVFTGFVYLGIVLAYFANYGCQVNLGDTTHNRWVRMVTSRDYLHFPVLTTYSLFLRVSTSCLLVSSLSCPSFSMSPRGIWSNAVRLRKLSQLFRESATYPLIMNILFARLA